MSMERWPECLLPVDESAERKGISCRGSSHRWEQKKSQRRAPIQTTRTMGGNSYYPPWRPALDTGSLALLCVPRAKSSCLAAWLRLRDTDAQITMRAPSKEIFPLLISGSAGRQSVVDTPKAVVLVCSCACSLVMSRSFVAREQENNQVASQKLDVPWELGCRGMSGKRFSQAQKWNQVAIYNVGKRQLVEWQLRGCGCGGRSSWIGLCSAQRHTNEGDSLCKSRARATKTR